MRARRFEDLVVWRAALDLGSRLYIASSSGPLSRDFGLKDQIRRAAVSVLSNIAEGFERNGDREFAHFLFLAKGSCGELRAQLHLARRLDYLEDVTFRELHGKSLDVSRMLSALIKSLRSSNLKGYKYRDSDVP